jgi:UPF0148 protein
MYQVKRKARKLGQAESRNRILTGADLLRRGATLLREACPRCGGVQIRYQGKVYCIAEDDLDSALAGSPRPAVKQEAAKTTMRTEATSTLRKMLEEKLGAVSKQLESTTDVEEQGKLLDLISKYVEMLEKLEKTVS